MANFPSYAKILIDGYLETPDYGVLRTEMDGGIAKQRPRYTTPIIKRSATIMVDDVASKRLFDEWIRVDLSGGSSWFSWFDPVSNKQKQARLVSGSISWSSPGVIWKATCEIETIG